LQELGFGLDLEKCAVDGRLPNDLAMYRPKDRPPPFSRDAGRSLQGESCSSAGVLAPRVTVGWMINCKKRARFDGIFPRTHVFWPHNSPCLPAAVEIYGKTLQR